MVEAKNLYARQKTAQAKKDVWNGVLRDAYALAMPMRNPYEGDSSKAGLMDRMYESTALQSTFKGANKMLLDLVPFDQTWFGLKAGPVLELEYGKNQNALNQLNEHLDRVVSVMAMVFQSGSFISSIHEAFLDLLVAGIGALLVLENPESDDEPVTFECVPQSEIVIEEGAGGAIGNVYRTRKNIEVRRIEEIWSDAKIPEDLQKQAEKSADGKEKTVDLLEVTYKEAKSSSWTYKVFWKKKDADPHEIVSREYTTNPWVVFRWSKIPGSPYGYSPILMALPDIKTANRVMEMVLKNAALALAGMYMVADDGVINPDTIQISNGGMIPVARTGGSLGASIAPLPTGRNFDLGQVVLDDLRMQIKKSLFDSGLPPLEGNVRSATEIIQRMRELTQELGGAIGRLTNELIVPLVRRVADILARRGYIEPLNINQYLIKVQVNSPLARSQQLQEVEHVVQWLEIAMSLGGQQGMMMAAKIEEVLPWIADKIGVPSELVRSKDEQAQMQKMVAEILAAQQAPANDVVQAPSQMAA